MIDYSALIPAEQKRAILEQRRQQFALEAWQHSLNRATAEALGDATLIAQADEALATLDVALAATADELAKLP